MIKIFIDAGHGGTDPGATGNGLEEKDLTLSIAKKTKDYLDNHYTGHTTRLSRDTDKTLTLKQRTDLANSWDADYFLSIHINAGGGTGYEDFIYNKLSDASQTARVRNIIHTEVSKAVGWSNRGKKKADYHVLRESKMHAMLTECGFIDSKADSNKLKQAVTIKSLAVAHAVGLANAFNLKKKAPTTPTLKPTTGKLYKVQVGAFSKKDSAHNLSKELEKKGYKTYIVSE